MDSIDNFVFSLDLIISGLGRRTYLWGELLRLLLVCVVVASATAAILDTDHSVLLCGDRIRCATSELAHRDEGELVEFAARMLRIFGNFAALKGVELLLRGTRR